MKQSVSLLETKRRALSPLFFLYLRSDSFNSHSFILKPILLIKATKSILFSLQCPLLTSNSDYTKLYHN